MFKNKEVCNCGEKGCSVTVQVDVSKIVKYLCIAGVLIIGIIFGTNCYTKIFKNK